MTAFLHRVHRTTPPWTGAAAPCRQPAQLAHPAHGCQATPGTQQRNGLVAYVLVLCALALALPAMRVPDSYHQFADQLAWGVLPYAGDVLSNVPFAAAGALLLWQVRQGRRKAMPEQAARALRVAGWGLVLTALCSALYHLRPDAAGLALDRVGMSVAFAGMLGVLVADRLPHLCVRSVLAASLLLGLACVAGDWLQGNMTPWALFQVGGFGLLLVVPLLTRKRGGQGDVAAPTWGIAWWAVLLCYALAKVCEMGDHAVWQWTGQIISGHSLKHWVAALAVLPVVLALRRAGRARPGLFQSKRPIGSRRRKAAARVGEGQHAA